MEKVEDNTRQPIKPAMESGHEGLGPDKANAPVPEGIEPVADGLETVPNGVDELDTMFSAEPDEAVEESFPETVETESLPSSGAKGAEIQSDTKDKGKDGPRHEGGSKTLVNDDGRDLLGDVPPEGLCYNDGDNVDGKIISSTGSGIFHGYAITRQGGRSENQDSFGACKTRRGFLMIVCDGMGGGPGGKTASMRACQKITDIVNSNTLPKRVGKSDDDVLNFALYFANYDLRQYVKDHPELSGMGTTCVLLLVTRNKAIVKHVGDSRLYQIRDGRKVYRTTDHSLVYELLKRHALKDEEEARLSPQSNVITSALGTGKAIPHIETEELPYKKGDRFLLSTDGVHGAMPEGELLDTISQPLIAKNRNSETDGLRYIMQGLADKLDSIGKAKGGRYDNLTGIMVVMDRNSAMPVKVWQKIKDTIAKLKIFGRPIK